MSFRICCPQCGAQCMVSDEDVGRTALCGNCDQPIVITKTPVAVARQESAFQPRSSPSAPHRVDPVQARALTQPMRQFGSFHRWRMGCIAAALAAAACLVVAIRITPLEQPRSAARLGQCRNNLKQIALALHNYHEVHGSLPPPYIADSDGRPMHSWRVLILPFMEQQQLYGRYRFDEPWDGPNNRLLWSEIPNAYRCPSADYPDSEFTPYQAVVGKNTVFEPDRTTSFADIYEGASNTILIVEAASSQVHWMEPSDVQYGRGQTLPQSLWSSNHGPLGLQVVYADGHTANLPRNIDDVALRSLIERIDGVYHVR